MVSGPARCALFGRLSLGRILDAHSPGQCLRSDDYPFSKSAMVFMIVHIADLGNLGDARRRPRQGKVDHVKQLLVLGLRLEELQLLTLFGSQRPLDFLEPLHLFL